MGPPRVKERDAKQAGETGGLRLQAQTLRICGQKEYRLGV